MASEKSNVFMTNFHAQLSTGEEEERCNKVGLWELYPMLFPLEPNEGER